VVVSDDLPYGNGASATVGIRDVNGQTNNRNLQWAFNQTVVTNGENILFSRLLIDSIIRIPPDRVRLHFFGAAQQSYVVEVASELPTFSSVGSATEQTPGSFTFEQQVPVDAPMRFYRVREMTPTGVEIPFAPW
jgi:hypothetical protein